MLSGENKWREELYRKVALDEEGKALTEADLGKVTGGSGAAQQFSCTNANVDRSTFLLFLKNEANTECLFYSGIENTSLQRSHCAYCVYLQTK